MIRRLIAIFALVYLLGFVLYTLTLPRPLENMKTDAIVVPTGAPGRILRINARGFTTGKTLWAHITRGKSKRTIKLGRLKGACGSLKTRKRLLPQNAALGVHTLQFDTFRRYNKRQPVRDRYTITVTRG